jgi:uncharacterized protein (UPF0332 family)
MQGQAFSSHAHVLGAFNRDFVHAGTFPREFAAILARLFEDRQTGLTCGEVRGSIMGAWTPRPLKPA